VKLKQGESPIYTVFKYGGGFAMSNYNNQSVTITPNLLDTSAIQDLERILVSNNSQPRLIGSNGETIALPEPIYQALRKVIRAMAEGKAISFAPSDCELSAQEAADILNVSRPYLIDKLLKLGEIPYTKVGNRHRIRLHDVMLYKQNRDMERRQALRSLTELLQDEGFYDE